MSSERPEGLSPMELEQYDLVIEEQAYPFEEQAIQVHESNLKLISRGVYNVWVEKSLQKLAVFVPARYDKPEETSGIINSLDTFIFEIDIQAKAEFEAAKEVVQTEKTDAVAEPETVEPVQAEEAESVTEPETVEPVQAEEVASATEPEIVEPVQAEEVEYSK
jgi:hypothetical protein